MGEAKLNVLIVHNYYQIPGGEDTVVKNEKKMLEEQGHKVIFYSHSNSELKEYSLIQKLMFPLCMIFNWKVYRDVRFMIQREHIDIVHVHNTLSIISPSVYYAAKKQQVPVVQTIHNFRLLCPGATLYRDENICEDCIKKNLLCSVKHGCYRNSRVQTLACVCNMMVHRFTGIYRYINYICLTDFNRQILRNLKGVEADRVYVKPNFVVASTQKPAGQNERDTFIFAGRIDKLKGIDILLEAWKFLGDYAPFLKIYGTGPMEQWATEYIRNNHLTRVQMCGFLPNELVRKEIAVARALILPTQWYEGFPMSIVEALSVGTPVLVSDLGNAGSIIKPGKNGLKFDHRSPESLAEAVQTLSDYPQIYDDTYQDYLKYYTEGENYKALKAIYDDVTRGEKRNVRII